jgi:hypothetical protein
MHRVEADLRGQAFALWGATLALPVVLSLAACSGSDVNAQPGPSTTGTATPSVASTIDPKALPAVQAYEAASEAANNAARHPFGLHDKIPAGADFAKYTFDPFRTQYRAYILGLLNQGGEYRGTSPRLNVAVTSIDLEAQPWPTVILSDCQTDSDNWRLHNAKTGAVQPRATPSISPPYRSTITMIYYEKHWGIEKLSLDASRTCTP